MNRLIAIFLQLMAAFFFVLLGIEGAEAMVLLLPAAISVAASLSLWGRGSDKPALPGPKSTPQADPALESQISRMEELMAGMQAELAALREGREFMDELYGGARGSALGPGSAGGRRAD